MALAHVPHVLLDFRLLLQLLLIRVGQSIARLFVPHVWWAFAAAFVLFRIFDVWKPLGANQAQKLPGGLGIVADDVIAGIVACGTIHLGLRLIRVGG